MSAANGFAIKSLAVLCLLGSSAAGAAIVKDFGIDKVTRHFVIGDTSSVVKHEVQFMPEGGTPQPDLTYSLSGQFDATFSHYWWSYYLDGDTTGSQGTFLSEANGLDFLNVSLAGVPQDFVFPDYFVNVDGSNLYGALGGCLPLGPDSYCTAFQQLDDPSVAGLYENGHLTLQGHYSPTGSILNDYSYSIQASEVPEPGTLALMAIVTLGCFVSRRMKTQSGRA